MVSAAPVALVPTLALSSSTRTAANSRAMMATPPTKPKPKPKPSKSILKTHVSTPPASAIGQKRKRVAISDLGLSSDDQDAEEEGNASSPVARTHPPVAKKRARVKFEMDMPSHSNKQQQRQEQDDDDDGDDDGDEKKGIENTRNEKSTAMVREEVRRAIQRHLIGDSEAYDRVKEIFAADPTELEDDGSPVYDLPSPTSLRNHLLGLFSNVSALDGSCSGLVHAVLRSEWLGRDEEYVKLFVRFLGTLAAARGTYLNSVLRVLVHGLRQAGPRTGKLPGYAIVYPSEIYARVHMAINFPHDTDTAKAHIVYTRNIIKIIDYAPELRSDILALITENSRTQFLLFHYSQSSPIFIDRFATTCVQIIFSRSEPTIIRQYAAAYLASFVARGAHVSSEVVRDVFDLLGTHLQNLQAEYEPTCRGPDLKRYGPFYSTAQALLYIFCFRWRDLTTAALDADITTTPASSAWLYDLDLDDARFPPQIKNVLSPAINSKLNPLKICSPAIVSEFARLTHHLHFMYLYTLIETNKRIRISSFRSRAVLAMQSRFGNVEREIKADDDLGPQLDAYFPFDPYHLPRSRRWVVDDYLEWRGIPGVDDREDEDEFDDDETTDGSVTVNDEVESEEEGMTGTDED
ncbi:conserved hypothetical protein [Histoplasma mississippiense (nom. inval.)]|uniref:RNA polymerase I-specific transcription initiation factor RRN3 family protein n=1 Tax=Ajellomyces capsulatus (strain NAm1 / WU24) TaxID=2059318 RepID=UPI000157C7C6|nr:RNA polymerase I-specific transcription initiation factor RRN3 family protein [Histoplasma mississippiense (nom. inval.)]EDN08193.1 conserved hypothetical protein [Histoplasma mississippiense (nom. inval.)]